MRYLFLLLFLSGCCSLCPPKIVYVAAECPKPSMLPASPDYTSEDLSDTASGKETIEAFVLDLETCQNHADQLEIIVNAYGAAYQEYKTRNPAPPK